MVLKLSGLFYCICIPEGGLEAGLGGGGRGRPSLCPCITV